MALQYAPAKKKPLLWEGGNQGVGAGLAGIAPKPKKVSAPKATPAPAAPAAAPAPTSAPPPTTLEGQDTRLSALGSYATGMTDVNRQLMEAAMRYGGAPQVNQFDPNSGNGWLQNVSTNPSDNSALSTIARNEALQGKSISGADNAANTFFGSGHIGNMQKNADDASRQRLSAKQDYESSLATLLGQANQLGNVKAGGLRQGDIADIGAANAAAPVPTTPQAAPKKAPARGFQFMQSEGPRAGLSYNLVNRGGKWYRKYENGQEIPR